MGRPLYWGVARKLLVITLLCFLTLAMTGWDARADNEATIGPDDFLPSYEGYRWRVLGIAGYGHHMTLTAISQHEDERVYAISGEIDDPSGGEADQDFSFAVSYTVRPDVIIQEKEDTALLDSKYDAVEILRAPITVGATWIQEVEGEDGVTTLQCSIEAIEGTPGEQVIEVLYEDTESPYFERRELQEGVGVISFERVMFDDDDPYEVSYQIFWAETGLFPDEIFPDVERAAWYRRFLGPVQRVGLIEGYPDGRFRPQREISVAEFTKTILAALGHHPPSDEDPWHQAHRHRAETLELIEPGEFDDFDRPITRQEMARFLARAVKADTPDDEVLKSFTDRDTIGESHIEYVKASLHRGFLQGYPDGTFRPEALTTRAEAAKVLSILLHTVDRGIFRPSDAIMLEAVFEERLIQDTVDDDEAFPRVKDFDRKADLVDHLAEITARDLAESYIDDLYEERSDRLYLVPRDGPIWLNEDVDFELRKETPERYVLSQQHWSGLAGDYELVITYRFVQGRWIIEDRAVDADG